MTWNCLVCTFASNTTDVCGMCTTPKPCRPVDMPIARDLFLCSQCSVPNAVSADVCVACDHDFNGPPSFLSCRACTCLNSARARGIGVSELIFPDIAQHVIRVIDSRRVQRALRARPPCRLRCRKMLLSSGTTKMAMARMALAAPVHLTFLSPSHAVMCVARHGTHSRRMTRTVPSGRA